jgi:hypothetical protein
MAKYYGKVGYAETVETEPGIWEESITERTYSGDFIQNIGKFQVSSSVNNNQDVSNKISIVSDPFAEQNYFNIRYVEYMGAKWNVTSVEIKYPRLILTIGGLYNGQ